MPGTFPGFACIACPLNLYCKRKKPNKPPAHTPVPNGGVVAGLVEDRFQVDCLGWLVCFLIYVSREPQCFKPYFIFIFKLKIHCGITILSWFVLEEELLALMS